MTVTLTAGISALSVFADNQIIAAVFAAITALVSAVNAGFNPPEKAKIHRETAHDYRHLNWHLEDLLHVLSPPIEYISTTITNSETPGIMHPRSCLQAQDAIPLERFSAVWAGFLKLREQVERIDEKAPVIRLGRNTDRRPLAG
jgi:hypothetical protein